MQELSDEAQCLFLRLFLRKGPWFRLNTLSYSELTEPVTAAQELSDTCMAQCTSTDAGQLQQQQQQLLYELAETLTVAELSQLLVTLELPPQGKAAAGSKSQMLQRLQAGVEQAEESKQVL